VKGKEAQKHNIHPHRLGSAGYKGVKWDESETISSSSGVSSIADSRSWRWLRAREKPTAEGGLTVPNPMTNEVLQRVVRELSYFDISINIKLIIYPFIEKIVTGIKGSRSISRFISVEPTQWHLECFDWDTRASWEATGALHICHHVNRLRQSAKEEK